MGKGQARMMIKQEEPGRALKAQEQGFVVQGARAVQNAELNPKAR